MGANCCRQYNDKPYELTNLNQFNTSNISQKKSSTTANILNKEKCQQQDENFKEEASVTYIHEPHKLEGENQEIKEVNGDVDAVESIQQSHQFLQDCIPNNNESSSESAESLHCDDTNTKKTILKHELRYCQKQGSAQNKEVIKKKVRFDLKSNVK
ncbi:unnamed protein product (macronuclear) [Paramecium tetraurelia]|uniref:Uncharacterized protein n=1 Tax=Paramecium tetraurelia TaxID=5888 RepID=A0BVH0_PARTE|nr:uncharacterized protein GSPATT00005783001 [Paramecium tetraurelia]CAK62537.1 unnamed protein product [Paramecium tetraurelia]|eukprot:XP_001429935.1 hypothetical protein (macronuclear) [Paramecium tetraurelia strain d4-2]